MIKTVQWIVVLLLVALMVFGMLPAAYATDMALEDTTEGATNPATEDVPATSCVTEPMPEKEPENASVPTEEPTTEPSKAIEEPTVPEVTEAPTETETTTSTEPPEQTVPEEPTVPDTTVPYLEEAVTGTVFTFGEQAQPKFRAVSPTARATLTGSQYQRAFVWLNGVDMIRFTYQGVEYKIDCLGLHSVYSNGTEYMAYCIDPGVNTNNSYGGYTGSETTWSSLSIDEQTAIGLAVLYGAPNGMSSADLKTMATYELATQIIIDELRLGYRSSLPPYQCTNEVFIKNFGTNADGTQDDPYARVISSWDFYAPISGENMDRALLRSAYDTIASNMADHFVLPSFASRYNAAAKTYEMTKQADGTYAVTLTDTNNILSKCTFTDGNGLTYKVKGNKLTITSKTAFDTVKSCTMTSDGGVAKLVPNLDKQVFYLWSAGSKQRLVSLAEAANDPLPLYFNVSAPEQNGTAKIIKKATNGGSVAGWNFTIKDASGSLVGSYTTDTSGVIEVELEPGSYTVTETNGSKKYWVNDATPTKSVTVKAGETASVTFTNKWRGQAQIIKTATNGGTVKGWHFTVKTSGGTKIGDYVTDATGIITLDLEPGTYTVTETDGSQKYWLNDAAATKTVTVKAGKTAKVTFQNQWRGQAQIIKTATNSGSVKGWEFTIQDSSGTTVGKYTTNDAGVIVADLDPGTYTVTETDRKDLYWVCDTQPKTVTVKAGETANVTFENRWIGKAKIIKTLANPEAGSVEGWSFSIKDKDGKEVGIYKTDSKGLVETDLEPGTYTVTEVLEEASLWECTTDNPQPITVTAGETAEVTFTNALRPGKISIEKVDFQGTPLSGVEFLLEWSQDGQTWAPVSLTTEAAPQIGGCATDGIDGGCLTTDSSGIVEFTGLYPNLQYRLTETKTQDGYQLLKEPIMVNDLTVNEDLHIALRVVNFREFTIPDTGADAFFWTSIGITLCGLACLTALMLLRRKQV